MIKNGLFVLHNNRNLVNYGWSGQERGGLHLGSFSVKVTKSVDISRHLVTSRTTVTESVTADLMHLLFMGEASVVFVKNNLQVLRLFDTSMCQIRISIVLRKHLPQGAVTSNNK